MNGFQVNATFTVAYTELRLQIDRRAGLLFSNLLKSMPQTLLRATGPAEGVSNALL